MLPPLRVLWLLALLAGAAPVLADENSDLDLLPEGLRREAPNTPEAAPPADPRRRVFVESASTFYRYREHLAVPPPTQPQPPWQERLSLDTRWQWLPSPSFRMIESARLSGFWEDHVTPGSQQSYRLDLRELYASWEAAQGAYVDAGRINLKSGVAVGFNPTDFFKTRAVVDRTTQDLADLRENRLGTAMVRGQGIWAGGSVTLAAAPKLYEPTRIYAADELPSFYPMWDRTNAQQRTLLKANVDVGREFSPELVLYREDDRSKYGLNLTYGLGKAIVLYAEWAGSDRARLAAEAVDYGKRTGTLPASTPVPLPGDNRVRFYQDAALGGSYTTESKVTVYLEYDAHEAGLSKDDWRHWFALGKARKNVPAVTGLLWYLRSYAQDQQEPTARESAVLRASWNEAFVRDLELDAFVQASLSDSSSLVQIAAIYTLSDHWTLAALGLAYSGGPETDRGSLPQQSSLVLKISRYF